MRNTNPPPKNAARVEREKRLAEALRANLKRRKSAIRTETSAGPLDPDRAHSKSGGPSEKLR